MNVLTYHTLRLWIFWNYREWLVRIHVWLLLKNGIGWYLHQATGVLSACHGFGIPRRLPGCRNQDGISKREPATLSEGGQEVSARLLAEQVFDVRSLEGLRAPTLRVRHDTGSHLQEGGARCAAVHHDVDLPATHKKNVLAEQLYHANDEQLEQAGIAKLSKIKHLKLQLAVLDWSLMRIGSLSDPIIILEFFWTLTPGLRTSSSFKGSWLEWHISLHYVYNWKFGSSLLVHSSNTFTLMYLVPSPKAIQSASFPMHFTHQIISSRLLKRNIAPPFIWWNYLGVTSTMKTLPLSDMLFWGLLWNLKILVC